MPRQRPLGPNVFVEPRSERNRENVLSHPDIACPNESAAINRAIPLATNFTAETITVDDDPVPVPVPDRTKKPRKRKRSRYQDAIFGEDEDYDKTKGEFNICDHAHDCFTTETNVGSTITGHHETIRRCQTETSIFNRSNRYSILNAHEK